jgi:hypothetical protein
MEAIETKVLIRKIGKLGGKSYPEFQLPRKCIFLRDTSEIAVDCHPVRQ